MSRGVMDRHPEGSENSLAQVLAGLEARLSRQLTMDRETIVGAIAGGPISGGSAGRGGGGGAGPIVLLPDDLPPCASCGRSFADPLRSAIHQRGCARLLKAPPPAAFAAQQRAEALRRQAWATLSTLSEAGGNTAAAAHGTRTQAPPALANVANLRSQQQSEHSQHSQHSQHGQYSQHSQHGQYSQHSQHGQYSQHSQHSRSDSRASSAHPSTRPQSSMARELQPPQEAVPDQQRPASRVGGGASPAPSATPPRRQSQAPPRASNVPAAPPPPPVAVPDDTRRTSSPEIDSSEYRSEPSRRPSESNVSSEWMEEDELCQEAEADDVQTGRGPPPSTAAYPDPSALDDDGPPPELVPCDVCGRNFAADRLDRHMKICEKQSKKKRKVFGESAERLKLQEKAAEEEAKMKVSSGVGR
jgi:hypothetical protein